MSSMQCDIAPTFFAARLPNNSHPQSKSLMIKQRSALVDGPGVHVNFHRLSVQVQEGGVVKMQPEGWGAGGRMSDLAS